MLPFFLSLQGSTTPGSELEAQGGWGFAVMFTYEVLSRIISNRADVCTGRFG